MNRSRYAGYDSYTTRSRATDGITFVYGNKLTNSCRSIEENVLLLIDSMYVKTLAVVLFDDQRDSVSMPSKKNQDYWLTVPSSDFDSIGILLAKWETPPLSILAPVYLAYSLCCGTQSFEAILTLSRQNTFQAVTGWDDCLEDKSDLEEDHPPTMELLSPAIPSSSLNVVANATQSIVVE
jgi:hypothetical protein